MPFKDFAVGEVLSSADVDLYLMGQVVIRCTSGTRPTPVQGTHIYETDTNRTMRYTGSVWEEVGTKPLSVFKSSDESLSSSTTHQDDNHLFLSVAANTDYWFDAYIMYGAASSFSGGGGGIEFSYSAPSGAILSYYAQPMGGLVDPRDGNVSSWNNSTSTFAGQSGVSSASFIFGMHHRGTLRVSGTAGTLQFRWAQYASSGTATVVKANSCMTLTRLG